VTTQTQQHTVVRLARTRAAENSGTRKTGITGTAGRNGAVTP
jgi:hypothetical protein